MLELPKTSCTRASGLSVMRVEILLQILFHWELLLAFLTLKDQSLSRSTDMSCSTSLIGKGSLAYATFKRFHLEVNNVKVRLQIVCIMKLFITK